ncbi:unnamed protein product, partial [Owenia fusiformis]
RMYALFIVASFGLFSVVFGFHNGAPTISTVCTKLLPYHGYPTQSTAAPYTISYDPTSYSPGSFVTVSITANSGRRQRHNFKGFLLQARDSSDRLVGEFLGPPGNTKTVKCSNPKDSFTHASNHARRSVTITWKAPAEDVGPVTFRAGVVADYFRYWDNVRSAPMPSS